MAGFALSDALPERFPLDGDVGGGSCRLPVDRSYLLGLLLGDDEGNGENTFDNHQDPISRGQGHARRWGRRLGTLTRLTSPYH